MQVMYEFDLIVNLEDSFEKHGICGDVLFWSILQLHLASPNSYRVLYRIVLKVIQVRLNALQVDPYVCDG